MLWIFTKASKIRPLQLILCGLTIISILLGQGEISVSQEARKVSKVAKQITVRIEGSENGSGVLVSKEGNIYHVLTAKHVVQYPDNYAVVTPDYSVHPQKDLRPISGVDLAVLSFTSEQEYMVAEVGNSDSADITASVWVAGFPRPGRENRSSTLHITNGEITSRPINPNPEGYDLYYSNKTRVGMSGGPVLNERGHLLGIHGLKEGEPSTGEKDVTVPASGWTNSGIPINTFKKVAPSMKIKLAQAPTPTAFNWRKFRLKDSRKNSSCKNLKADIDYWKNQQVKCIISPTNPFKKNCWSRTEELEKKATQKWISAGCNERGTQNFMKFLRKQEK